MSINTCQYISSFKHCIHWFCRCCIAFFVHLHSSNFWNCCTVISCEINTVLSCFFLLFYHLTPPSSLCLFSFCPGETVCGFCNSAQPGPQEVCEERLRFHADGCRSVEDTAEGVLVCLDLFQIRLIMTFCFCVCVLQESLVWVNPRWSTACSSQTSTKTGSYWMLKVSLYIYHLSVSTMMNAPPCVLH